MIIIASLFFFFSSKIRWIRISRPQFRTVRTLRPKAPFPAQKVCLRHKTLLYSIFRLFQSLSSKKLVIFFSIADKVDDTFALIEVQTKNIEFAESFSVRCRCVKEAQEGGGRVKGVRVERTPNQNRNWRERERVFPALVLQFELVDTHTRAIFSRFYHSTRVCW